MSNNDFKKIIKYLNRDVQDVFDNKKRKVLKTKLNVWLIVFIIVIFLIGVFGGLVFDKFITERSDFLLRIKDYLGISGIEDDYVQFQSKETEPYSPQTSQEQAVIKVVKQASPAVVSIVVTKELPVYEEYYEEFEDFFGGRFRIEIPRYRQEGTEKKEVGGGTGFIISEDGLILTNKHVVLDEEADYTVITNNGERYEAKVLAKDPFQDLAIVKIDMENELDDNGELLEKKFPVLKLGDSSVLEIGQTVITIGNALGEFRNTVSVGVISGLGRRITASGGGIVETLEDVIQTDAGINKGNSGGPLLNLKGEVIGVNVAMAEEAQSIGFSIPINKAKRDIVQIKTIGKIVYPFLGIRYVLVSPELQEQEQLEVDYGALIVKGNDGEPAVIPDSAADKAGLKEGDIILTLNGKKITLQNSLATIIQTYNPGAKVVLEVLRRGDTIIIEAILGEKTST